MTGAPLRITHVVTNADFAGTERYVVDVSTRQSASGHQVTVIGGQPAAMTRLLPPGARWLAGGTSRAALRALARSGRRDIVHSHIAKSDFLALGAAAATGGSRVSTRHITAARGYTPKARELGRVVRRALDCEIAVSRWTSDQLDRPADAVLLNGVVSQPDVDGPREHTVVIAQRLAPEKDTAIALRAWAHSGLQARGWHLAVAGTGTELEALSRLTRELGVADSVRFRGWVENPAELFRTAAMLLAPAPTEPCGLTVLEAMAHGMPVVAAGSAGHLETVGTLAGAALFPAGDHIAAAAQLQRLADDEPSRERYGRQLRELQRAAFDIDDHVDRLETIYRQAIARRRARLRQRLG